MWNDAIVAIGIFLINIPITIVLALSIGMKFRRMLRDAIGRYKDNRCR